jgi:hypothetical protein
MVASTTRIFPVKVVLSARPVAGQGPLVVVDLPNATEDTRRAAMRGAMGALANLSHWPPTHLRLPHLAVWAQFVQITVTACPHDLRLTGSSLALPVCAATWSALINRPPKAGLALTGQVRTSVIS